MFPSIAGAQICAHYINVEQAESILLESRTTAILIDEGKEITGDNTDSEDLLVNLNQEPTFDIAAPNTANLTNFGST